MIPRIGYAPQTNRQYKLRSGTYAILPLQNRVLLTAQMSDALDIQLPGGGIDPGESPIQALHREVFEETGWKISKARRLGAFRRFAYMPEYDLWAEKLCTIYVAHPVYQMSEPTEPDHKTLVLSPTQAVNYLGNDGDRMFVQQYFGL